LNKRRTSNRIRRPWSVFFRNLFGWLLIWLGFSNLACGATNILVLQSHDSLPYRQTLEGFKSSLAGFGVDADYEIVTLHGTAEVQALPQQLQDQAPKLILTLGTPATRAALALERRIPLVAGLVLDTAELRQNPNATGIGLNFPASLQWTWLRRLLPEAQRIGVIYDPQHGSALFQALQQQARAENMTLTAAPATNPEDLPSLTQNLPSQLDALWAVEGAAAFNPTAVRELLLYSFRNRTPLIGLSAQWVKAGAIYALDWDYSDLGAQVAELASAILQKGESPASLQPQEPRKVRPVLNIKTVEHMKLQVSDQWLPAMAEVFR